MSEQIAPYTHTDKAESLSAPTVDVRALRAAAEAEVMDPITGEHVPMTDGNPDYCAACCLRWPCDVARDRQELAALLDRLEALEAALIVVFHREDGSPVAAICAVCNKMLCSDRPEEDARFPGATKHARNCRVRGLISSEMARAALGREEASRE